MTITQSSTRLVAVAAGVAVALVLMLGASMPVRAAALSQTQIQSILNLLTSFGADQGTINNVSAALNGQATTGTTGGTTMTGGVCPFTWSEDLTIGSTGADVQALQEFLNMNAATMVAASGAGSPGQETTYFGPATQAAVANFQTANGITPNAGYFGPVTRAKVNSLCTGSSTGTTGTGTGTGVTVSGNGLGVTLAATSPNNTVLVAGQGIGDLGEFTFSNPSTAPITVTGMTFMRIGVSNDQTINNVYLYNGVTRLTDSAGISNSQFSFTSTAGLFTVPAGSTFTVAVRADLATGTSGQQIGVELSNVAASGSLASSVVFPVMSGYQTISNANLATAVFDNNVIPSNTGTGPTISPQSDYPLWQDNVSVSVNPVWLQSMRFTNLGSIDASAVTNLRLYVDGNQVGAAVPSLAADRSVTFDLSASPLSLSTQSHVIRVLGDVVGGASRTIQLSIQRSSDVMFVDSQLNQPIQPTISGLTNFTALTSGAVLIQAVSGTSGVSVSKDPASPINDLAVSSTNQDLATFDFLASGEDTKVSDLYVYASSTAPGGGVAGVGGIKNGRIMVTINGVQTQVGSTKDIVEGNTIGDSSNSTDFSLGSSLVLPAGQQVRVDIYGDTKDTSNTNFTTGSRVQVYLAAGVSNAQGQSSYQSANVPGSDTGGNSINVSSASFTASSYSAYANQTVIPGATNALLGEFSLSAGSIEGVNVNTIGLNVPNGAATTTQNLKLVDMSTNTQIGTIINTPSVGTNTFSVNLNIPVSSTKTIGVYGNILSNASQVTYTPFLSLVGASTQGNGATTGSSIQATNQNLQAITFGTGSYTLSLGAGNPVSSNVVSGANSLLAGDFTFSANNSSLTVQKLEVDASSTAATAITSLALKDATGNTIATLNSPTTNDGTNATYQFSGLNFTVPMNDSADLYVYIGTPTISSGSASISGQNIVVALNPSANFQAIDQSGTQITNIGSLDVFSNGTTGYGKLVVRKSVPTFAGQSNSTSAEPNNSTALYQFTVSADAAGAIDLDKLSFNISTSSIALTGFQLFDAANTSQPLNAATTVTANNNGNVVIVPDQIIQVGASQTKTFILRAANISSSNWSGGNVSVHFATPSASPVANAAVSGLSSSNFIWTDRSSNTDSTGTAEWTNGYLLKDLVSGTYSFTANF